jgi:phage tail sheath gpL-like
MHELGSMPVHIHLHLWALIALLAIASWMLGTIATSVPSTRLSPGRFIEFNVTDGARGLTPSTKRLGLIGGMTSAGTATVATPYQIFTESEADSLFGAGSELALMCRSALAAARKAKQSPAQIWAVGVADAGGSAAATYTMTVTGTATATGTWIIKIAGRLIYVPVTTGDANTVVAAALKAAIDAASAKKILPVTAGISSNVVTITAVNKGPVGNDIRTPTNVQTVAGTAIAHATGVVGSGAYDPTNAFNSLVDKRYARVAIGNHASGDITKAKAYVDLVGLPQTKKFSGVVLAEYGTVSAATTLAAAANYRQITVAGCRDFPRLPGEVAAGFAMTALIKFPNPAQPLNGVELDEPPCPITSVYTDAERETLLAAGVTPLVLNASQDQGEIVKWVSTMTTVGGAQFYGCLAGQTDMVLAEAGLQIDNAWALAFPSGTLNDSDTQKNAKSVALDRLKVMEEAKWIQNVDAHKDELRLEVDLANPQRDNIAVPLSVVPGLDQIDAVITLFTEAPAA